MKIVKIKNVVKEPAEMTGGLMTGTQVYRQNVLRPGESKNFNFGIVSFSAGSRNKFHKHSSDQILVITEGVGKVATRDSAGKVKELAVRKGDVVLIPAGEDHWHGAPGGTSMAHITVTGNGSQTTQTER